MPILAVSLDNGAPSMRTVQLRTARLVRGVLCDVWADNSLQLCMVERVNPDGSLRVRRLPAMPARSGSAAPLTGETSDSTDQLAGDV